MKSHIIVIFLLVSFLGFSQNQPTPESKLGTWYMLDGTHKITDKLKLKTGFHLRTFELADNLNLLFYYTGINYVPNKSMVVTLGYCYLDIDRTYSIAGESHLYENRPYEQILYKHKLGSFSMDQRLRLEHRFLNYQHDHTIQHRFRYRLGGNININKQLFAYIQEELFINTTDRVFRENRLTTGLGIHISPSNHFKIGYLNHEINRQNLDRLQLGLFLKTDLRKKKLD